MLIKCIDGFVLATIVNVRQKRRGDRGSMKPRKETGKLQVTLKSGCWGTKTDTLRAQILWAKRLFFWDFNNVRGIFLFGFFPGFLGQPPEVLACSISIMPSSSNISCSFLNTDGLPSKLMMLLEIPRNSQYTAHMWAPGGCGNESLDLSLLERQSPPPRPQALCKYFPHPGKRRSSPITPGCSMAQSLANGTLGLPSPPDREAALVYWSASVPLLWTLSRKQTIWARIKLLSY